MDELTVHIDELLIHSGGSADSDVLAAELARRFTGGLSAAVLAEDERDLPSGVNADIADVVAAIAAAMEAGRTDVGHQ